MATSSTERVWTVGELLNWTADFLAQKEIEHPRLDAEVLLARALECRRIDLYGLRFADVAGEEVRQRYRDLIRKRLEGCPVAYLVGRKEFFSLELDITPAVLIPRPDSELLVTECLDLARGMSQPRILDIGTGSGNLAVAVAYHLPTAEVTAIDVSEEALNVARRNAEKHAVEDRIRFVQGDVFVPLADGETFDIILSNPPYIPREELSQLPVGVRDYEPADALDGGANGYDVFDRILRDAPRYLKPGGYLLIEIGSPQESTARRRIEAFSRYELTPTIHDHAGHPRVLKIRSQ